MSEVYICRLPVDVQDYAAKELHETEETRQSGFKEIKKWAADNSHLHVRTEDKYILPFLRGCKFDLDKTKGKLENFYNMRRDRTEWYTNRNPHLTEIQEVCKLGSFLALKKTHENHLVIIVRPTLHDPKSQSLDNVLKLCMMVADIAMMESELAQVYGVIAVIDMSNVSFAHAKQLTITRIKHLVFAWQNYYCRPKRIEFINAPSYINVILSIFKSFMSEKLRKRVHVRYGENFALTDIIDKSVLPPSYGGEGETLGELEKYWSDKLVSYKDWFREDEVFKADAS